MKIYKENPLKSTCNNRFLIQKDTHRYLVLWNGVTDDGGVRVLPRQTKPIELKVDQI